MRYRALDANGDYTFGQSAANFLVNNSLLVAQAIRTRLLLMQGEWFLDKTEGTPYSTQILGKGTRSLYDQAIKTRILGTQGVNQIVNYSSNLNNRVLTVNALVNTIFGPVTVVTALSIT